MTRHAVYVLDPARPDGSRYPMTSVISDDVEPAPVCGADGGYRFVLARVFDDNPTDEQRDDAIREFLADGSSEHLSRINQPAATSLYGRRFRVCAEAFGVAGDYDPSCCRWPKSCSPYPYEERIVAGNVAEDQLEPAAAPVERDDGVHPEALQHPAVLDAYREWAGNDYSVSDVHLWEAFLAGWRATAAPARVCGWRDDATGMLCVRDPHDDLPHEVHPDGIRPPTHAEPGKVCSNPDHWHLTATVPATVCVRGLLHGLQQESAGFTRALDAVEAGDYSTVSEQQLAGALRTLGARIDHELEGRDRQLHEQVRILKVCSEAGEVQDALDIAQGWNPRKAGTKTYDDVVKELLNTAVAALGAVEFLRGYDGTAPASLVEHAVAVATRIEQS